MTSKRTLGSTIMHLMTGLSTPSIPIARSNPDELLNRGIGVSTVNTADMGLETALLHRDGVSPVQRYDTKAEAQRGHDTWVTIVRQREEDKLQIRELGYGGFPAERKYIHPKPHNREET